MRRAPEEAAGWRCGPLWIAGGPARRAGPSGAIARPGAASGRGRGLLVHGSGTIRSMNLIWVGVAFAAVVILAVVIKRLVASGDGTTARGRIARRQENEREQHQAQLCIAVHGVHPQDARKTSSHDVPREESRQTIGFGPRPRFPAGACPVRAALDRGPGTRVVGGARTRHRRRSRASPKSTMRERSPA